MKSEPTRLLEDPLLSGAERSALEMGRAQHVGYDVSAGLERFRANLSALSVANAAMVSADGGNAFGASGKSTLLGKLGVKALVLIGVPAAAVAGGVALRSAPSGEAPGHTSTVAEEVPHIASNNESRAPAPAVAVSLSKAIASIGEPRAPGPGTSTSRATVSAPAQASHRAEPPSVAEREDRGAPAVLALGRRSPAAAGRPASPITAPVGGESTPPPKDVAAGGVTERRDEAKHGAASSPDEGAPPAADDPAPAPSDEKPHPVAWSAASEMRAVARARGLVNHDPAGALSVLDELRRENPSGYLVEERRALTVLALVRLGRRTQARQQAGAFLRAYPNSPLGDKVRTAAGL